MPRTKYIVFDFSTGMLLGENLTRKDAENMVKNSTNRKQTKLSPIKVYDTNQCVLYVHPIFSYNHSLVYVIRSVHKNTNKITVRYGSYDQIQSMLNTYQNLKGQTFVL